RSQRRDDFHIFAVSSLTALEGDAMMREVRCWDAPVRMALRLHRMRRAEGEAIGLRISILASGSSGNITLLETEKTRLLVDAGLGKRETLARLAAVGKDVEHIDGILITHEHSDH